MKQQEILKKLIPEFRTDTTITGVMLMEVMASEVEYSGSDLDFFILGKKNKIETDLVDDIKVEYLYINHETAQSRLDKSGMEIYHYLGSKIIYDLDGRLIKLMRCALNKYKNYKVSEKDKAEIRYCLYNTKRKMEAAACNNTLLGADYITATASSKVIEAVFAVNEIPFPPTYRVLQELPNIKKIPMPGWFEKLFSRDTDERISILLYIIDWVLMNV